MNWIIGGTDAHAKNFSMLIGAGGRARFAPLYDVASTLPYGFDPKKLKMATSIGGKYRLEEIRSRHWMKFAADLRIPPAEVLDLGRTMAETLPGAFAEIVGEARTDGLEHPIVERMIDALSARSKHCARVLETAAN